MEYKDYYKSLGIGKTASQAEIKKAYRKLARELHPDRNPGDKTAERRFKEVNEANAVLSDPDKRKQYDMLGANWEQYARAGAGAASGNPYAGFGGAGSPFGFGGPGAGGTGGQYTAYGPNGNVRVEFHGADAEGFSDFFRMFFSGADSMGGDPMGAAQTAQSPDRARTRTRSQGSRHSSGGLDDLLTRLRHASGGTPGATAEPGNGATRQSGHGSRGRGGDAEVEVDLTLEEAYHGSSRLIQVGDKRLEVKVPAGVETGSKIRLRGKGPDGGDLYLVARVRPHAAFSRNGADLTRDVPVTLREALLGGEVEVATLSGKVLLKIPAGTQQGQTFRLTGKGMPRLRGEGHGDLYARIKVVLPTRLDDRAREAAQAFLEAVDQPNPRT